MESKNKSARRNFLYSQSAPLLQKKRKKEVSSFLYHSSSEANAGQLNDSRSHRSIAADTKTGWGSLQSLKPGLGMHNFGPSCTAFFGKSAIESRVGWPMHNTKPHESSRMLRSQNILEEFEELWNWMTDQWRAELSDTEQETFALLGTETERDLFRILRNFARYAAHKKQRTFPFPIQHVAARLGVSFQYVSKLRQRFLDNSIIRQTEPAITNRQAARVCWCLTLELRVRSNDGLGGEA